MSRRNSKTILHNFYCINCGNKGIELMRQQSHKHSKHHRKKLYCIHCQCEVNHVECKNERDIQEFKWNFRNGVYKDEVENSLSFMQSSGIR